MRYASRSAKIISLRIYSYKIFCITSTFSAGGTGWRRAAGVWGLRVVNRQRRSAHRAGKASNLPSPSTIISLPPHCMRSPYSALCKSVSSKQVQAGQATPAIDHVLNLCAEDACFCMLQAVSGQVQEQREAMKGRNPAATKLSVDPFLRIVGARDAIAMGDCSRLDGRPLPATAQVQCAHLKMSPLALEFPACQGTILEKILPANRLQLMPRVCTACSILPFFCDTHPVQRTISACLSTSQNWYW